MRLKRIALPYPERLIVAFDPTPPVEIRHDPALLTAWLLAEVIAFAEELRGTGVIIKLNAALRALGYQVILELHKRGLKVFADLKLDDIGATLALDGLFLDAFKPAIVTVKATAYTGIRRLKQALPDTEVLIVPVLTTYTEKEREAIYGNPGETTADTTLRLLECGLECGGDGFICAPAEIRPSRAHFGDGVTIHTPNVRPVDLPVTGDDQNAARGATVTEAFEWGTDRVVVGRPVTQSQNKRASVILILKETARVKGYR